MKRLLLIATLAASASACVQGNNPVQLLDAIPPDPAECGKQGSIALLSGSLNYNASNQYFMSFSIFSPLSTEQTTSGTGFIGSEIVYNYEARGVKGVTFKEEVRPIYFVVDPGASPEDSYVILDLIGDEARKKLDGVVPASPDTLTLLTTLKIKGKLASGKSVETNEVTFPITITRAPACAENQKAVPLAATPCGNPGQDGNGFTCL
jgi:hypothetical protein